VDKERQPSAEIQRETHRFIKTDSRLKEEVTMSYLRPTCFAISGLCMAAVPILFGCQSTPSTDTTAPQSAAAISIEDSPPASNPELTFFDADVFDSSLGKALEAKPQVVHVAFAAPTSLNSMPPRINVWLSEVKNSD
jgi:hypothetical protein